jgi:hypothetical protein
MQNVKKRILKDKDLKQYEQMILKDINFLHESTSYSEYVNNYKTISEKWSNINGLSSFYSYFHEQWVNSIFCNWQLYSRAPGFATTNNTIESFNKQIKQSFTKYESYMLIKKANDCNITVINEFQYSVDFFLL